ncbi:carbohydrate-binding protein [candidate division KSB1 bacterium]|nr:aryl-sulfate sulfotransferase [candidate division KSB1 bacterium]RQW06983.1 MAG: carbohydrate-binding protein [candidate division KSB1 bacterium]
MLFRQPITLLLTVFFTTITMAHEYHNKGYQYLYPLPNARHIPEEANLMIRFNNISPYDIKDVHRSISVTGETGKRYEGTCKIASDQKTIIFSPNSHFKPGEIVRVSLAPELIRGKQGLVEPISYQFIVTASVAPELPEEETADDRWLDKNGANIKPVQSQARIMPNGVSVPSNFPHINITINDQPDDGYIFIDNRGGRGIPYNIIFDNTGSPIWYWQVPDERRDFKVQYNGWATMIIRGGYEEFGGSGQGFLALDNRYRPVKTFYASNGYYTDEHELQVLENGGYLIIGRRDERVDMSQYVPGGRNNALVQETCIQEYTADDELIFQWAAWDHLDIRDIQLSDPLSNRMYFSHMNSIDIDDDGHLIVSNRELSEITKIHRQTGDIIWRLGGAHNQFTFINDPLQGTRNQHAARVLGNNVYSIFDNGNGHNPPLSRAVKYKIDTDKMTATLIWEFRDQPDKYSHYMGNAQPLPNGNMLINWAVGHLPKLTEVRPDGSKAFEMNWVDQYECYRVHRCSWNGVVEVPRLQVEEQTDNITLLFNKFGDPDVDYYRIYAGNAPHPTTVIDTSRVTLKKITNIANGHYWFRVTAVSTSGQESGFSNEETAYVSFLEPGANLVENFDFSAGRADWTWELQGNGQAEWSIENGVAHINISDGGSNDYDVQLRQNGIPLTQGSKYLFEFDAWADATRLIEAKIGQDQSPYINYSKTTYSQLRERMTHFSYEFDMQDPSDFNARIVFNMGNSDINVYLDNISVKQKLSQSSFTGSPQAIPGTIQCEEYDFGGEGIAYHDDDAKAGDTSFRPEDNVDVEPTLDFGGSYNIGWTENGEWLEYTVDVEAGTYYIQYRTASSPGGGVLNVLLDGKMLTQFDVPATGGWQSWMTLVERGVEIAGGSDLVLRLEIVEGNHNMNWIKFIKLSGDAEEEVIVPQTYQLAQNFPNPFNPETRIDYQLPQTDHVVVRVYNVLGAHITTLVNKKQTAGTYSVVWDGTNETGQQEASGVYLVHLQTPSFQAVRKMTLLR